MKTRINVNVDLTEYDIKKIIAEWVTQKYNTKISIADVRLKGDGTIVTGEIRSSLEEY